MIKFILLFFSILCFLTSSCITLSEKRSMQNELTSLQNQLEVLRKRLEKETKAPPTEGQLGVAELNTVYEEIREDVQKSRSEVEANRHLLDQDKQAINKMLEDMDLRLQSLEKQIDQLEKNPSLSTNKSKSKEPQKSDKELFEEALSYIHKKNKKNPSEKDYEKARNFLQELIDSHPKSSYKPDAYFWRGETYLAEKKYKHAFLEFEQVWKISPDHPKAPTSRLNQGICLLELGNEKSAKVFFHSVTKKFPKTNEAKIAKEKLSQMDKKNTQGKDQAKASSKNPSPPKTTSNKPANQPLEEQNLNPR